VEIYNRSAKFIDLRWLELASGENPDWKVKISNNSPLVLPPAAIKAFTINKSRTLNDFPGADPKNIIEVDYLPPLHDDRGSIILKSGSGTVIDRLDYSEDFHFSLLNGREGVSLERIQPDKATDDRLNWVSASSQCGHGTPGAINSTVSSATPDVGFQLFVEPKVFLPGLHGLRDNKTIIHYDLESPGHVGTLVIFDIRGNPVITLANNELLSAEGTMEWDGRDATGRFVRMGYYIIILEIFNLKGGRAIMKGKVAVASQF
jgi:hypothetical protein